MGNKVGSFGFSWKVPAEGIVKEKDFTGKTVLITGTSSGIGVENMRVFYKFGANVHVFNRNRKKTEKAIEDSKKQVEEELKKDDSFKIKPGKIIVHDCDLSSQSDVIKATSKWIKENSETKIDILIGNAGIMIPPFSHTVDGYESQIGINHFGHFTFTLSLLPHMNEPSRIVIVSSIAHRFGTLNFDDMNYYKRKYSAGAAYGQSKISNVYFARELNRLLEKANKKIIVSTLHPGSIQTGLGSENKLSKVGYTILGLVGYNKSVIQGASTTMLAATHEKITKGGIYYDDNDVGNLKAIAKDMKIANALFKVSLKDTGMKFPFEIEGEDINNLEGVKSSRPDDWKEKMTPRGGKKKVEKKEKKEEEKKEEEKKDDGEKKEEEIEIKVEEKKEEEEVKEVKEEK